MTRIYSESVLASYVTYKELYSNNNYRSAYQILAEFVKFILASEEIYRISVPEIKKKVYDVFGFNLPEAVIRAAIKRNDYIEKITNSEDYVVKRQNLKIDPQFMKYRERAERDNTVLTEMLISYVEEKYQVNVNKKELVQEFIAYLIDESNGGKYQEAISAFILENSVHDELVNQLNSIREGSILYMGLNCNIVETGSITNELTLYFDMEILFDIYGYNGEVFKSLASDLISLVKEANRNDKKIKLKYFEETKNKISDFFLAAAEIVKSGSYLKENVAMKAIVNGCKDLTDVNDKESDFFHNLQYQYGITLDDRKEYYLEDDYAANLEEQYVTDEEQLGLKYLSNINKMRKNQVYYDYTKVGYLFVTETWKTLELSKKISYELGNNKINADENGICRLAVNMSFLTNLLWYKLNRGFGVMNYPYNLDSVIKAKIVLSNFISQNVVTTYDKYKKEYADGELTVEQMAGRLLGLHEKASKPEDITVANLSDNLNFDPKYLCRYEKERELQRVKLEEKEEVIQQLTLSSRVVQEELEVVKNLAESSRAIIDDKEAIIATQKAEIEKKDRLLERYQKEEQEKNQVNQHKKRIRRFVFHIMIRFVFILLIGSVTYFVSKAIKADNATTVGLIVTVISIVLGAIDIVARVYHKIFDIETSKN